MEKSNEYLVFGIPGAGKTTYLQKSVEQVAERLGGENIVVSSFTRAAAAELTGRDLPIPAENVGTLHSLCFRALGNPTIAESKMKDFNEKYPEYRLSPQTKDMDEPETDQKFESEWDRAFSEYQINRAQLIPKEKWRQSVRAIASKWCEWKAMNGMLDFTDLIEHALDDMIYPPNNATVGIFDECQDFTPLQLKLVRSWANQLKYLMIAGDDDQAIYSFLGAQPGIFLETGIPQDNKRYLTRSYRVPRVIQEYAKGWIEKIKAREPKEQHPKIIKETEEVVEGKLSRVDSSYKDPGQIIGMIEQDIKADREVMVLASCSYMLNPLLTELRKRGIPFHNKYRRKRGDWNPLKTNGTSTASRMLAFLEPEGPVFGGMRLWSMEQLAAWVELCKTKGFLKNGGKKRIQELKTTDLSDEAYFDLLAETFIPEQLDKAIQFDVNWLTQHLTPAKARAADYPLAIMNKQGIEKLKEVPRVIIGTIHSTKGGQSQHVILHPDVSMNAARQAETKEGREAIIRCFYVGMTRASEELTIAKPAGDIYAPII